MIYSTGNEEHVNQVRCSVALGILKDALKLYDYFN